MQKFLVTRMLTAAALLFSLPAYSTVIEILKEEVSAAAIAGISYFNAEFSDSYSGDARFFRGASSNASVVLQSTGPENNFEDVYAGVTPERLFTLGAAPNLSYGYNGPGAVSVNIYALRYWLDGPTNEIAHQIWDSTYSRIDFNYVQRFRVRGESIDGQLIEGGLNTSFLFNEDTVSVRDLTDQKFVSGRTFLQDHLYELRIDISGVNDCCFDNFESYAEIGLSSNQAFTVTVPAPEATGLLALGLIVLMGRRRKHRDSAMVPNRGI